MEPVNCGLPESVQQPSFCFTEIIPPSGSVCVKDYVPAAMPSITSRPQDGLGATCLLAGAAASEPLANEMG